MKFEEIISKAVEVESNVVMPGYELLQKLDSSKWKGALVKALFYFNGSRYMATALYIRNEGFLWSKISRVDEGESIVDVEREEANVLLANVSLIDPIIADIYWLMEEDIQKLLKEIGDKGSELERSIIKKHGEELLGKRKDESSPSLEGIKLENVEGIEAENLKEVLDELNRKLMMMGVQPNLKIDVKFKKFALGTGGIFSIRISGVVQDSGSAPLNIRKIIEETVKESFQRVVKERSVVKVETNIQVE